VLAHEVPVVGQQARERRIGPIVENVTERVQRRYRGDVIVWVVRRRDECSHGPAAVSRRSRAGDTIRSPEGVEEKRSGANLVQRMFHRHMHI
jgi:hypothetical protein